MCNEITEEERARIVSELKTFSLTPSSLEKLIAITESAPTQPRTLEDIKNDVLYSGLTSDSESLVLSLVDEAYELGRKFLRRNNNEQ